MEISQENFTPLMRQYFRIKEQYKDAIVFFRLGDFYEMFGDDAKIASNILGLTLTSRDKSKENPISMCGIPYFAANSYIEKLLREGYKIAICEQIGDPKTSKGIVEREVVKVLTPGTFLPEGTKENVYIMAVYPQKTSNEQGRMGIALADITTAEFIVYETEKNLFDEIVRFEPKEIIVPKSLEDLLKFENLINQRMFTLFDDWKFDYMLAYKSLIEHFKVSSLKSFGLEDFHPAIQAAGALLRYLEENKQETQFKQLKVLNLSDFMLLDGTTKKNLEILSSLDGQKEGSLLWVLDETNTPMGTRFLRNALSCPLLNKAEIEERLDGVEVFFKDFVLRENVDRVLNDFPDIERLGLKIKKENISPRELKALKEALQRIPELKKTLQLNNSPVIQNLLNSLYELNEVVSLIDNALADNPPNTINEGGIFRDGYNSIVDELRTLKNQSKDYILKMETEERIKTGINSLKIGYNRVFGYYIEITKPNLKLVPSHYIRKQTLANAERFETKELKELEQKILSAEERLKIVEEELFRSLIKEISKNTEQIFKSAETIGYIDFLCCLAKVASKYKYTRPEITEEEVIEIVEGRHPVIERLIQLGKLPEQRFIPNDLSIGSKDQRIIILTGPNMAGKSTYMRQNALIILMAQIGSFVPAKEAKIGIVDRIFTRIGASDYLGKGQSTFMVEMIEVANILNNATEKSFIILDEVGRGTSTFDGISIAWAVVEYIAEKIMARTLFATHYHELTDLAFSYDCIKNYTVVVKEWGDEIIFLRKIQKGGADKSYGIQVARLAGLPQQIILRAKEILKKLEKKEFQTFQSKAKQLDLFFQGDPVLAELAKIDVENITPQKALKKLKELKEMIRND
ncbi:DNA mismatch repair protein MutS [Thermodesulfovibrio aggregans]|uniref:DNA mismatch repair protein MutS n=2 Tax=Thermodesulfovibrio aggregans TaxID=86166 RepID=A0A0U9HSP2_9BACT|nr:DNA mismatch repair protein MutS [Thermodesulfovibrio aggregans]